MKPDHEEAKRIADRWSEPSYALLNGERGILARAYLALLTEHYALREALENAPLPFAGYEPYADEYYAWYHRGARVEALALPATEPAQPEEEPKP